MLTFEDIPGQEKEYFCKVISDHPEYLDTSFVIKEYLSCSLDVLPDPFSGKNIGTIKSALIDHSPLSVIRVGDGEANLLTYSHYFETPILNDFSFKKIVLMQQNRFRITPEWMVYLQELMYSSILQADIIGVIGLWRPGKPTTSSIIKAFNNDPRGISGHWRAVDYLLSLAKSGYLNSKIITSAHLYFEILDNLHELIKLSKYTYIISNKDEVAHRLQNRYDKNKVQYLPIGKSTTNSDLMPSFLYKLHQKLPPNLNGCLCLIGAGPWSEIYCSWIKQRGGVAIDIGSGFDLLEGKAIRPIHKLLKLDEINPYYIKP